MPDQSSAADEHALLQEITAPLSTLPDDAVHVAAEADFPVAFRGYDRLAVDAYVKKTSQLVAELQSTRSPEAAVRRALERVGEQISGILQRAHETAEQITSQSRREAEDRLVVARQEAAQIAAASERRVKDLDAETDRIWAERLRIVEDARELAAQLLALADEATARFPPAEDTTGEAAPERASAALFDAEVVEEEDAEDSGKSERTSTEGGAERRGEGPERPPASVPPPPAGARRSPPPVSEPRPAGLDGPELQPEPGAEASEGDDPEATAILPPNRARRGAPAGDEGGPPAGVRMPAPGEPAPTAEHPAPGSPAPTAEHPAPGSPAPTAEHPARPQSQSPPDPPPRSR